MGDKWIKILVPATVPAGVICGKYGSPFTCQYLNFEEGGKYANCDLDFKGVMKNVDGEFIKAPACKDCYQRAI